MTYCAPRSLWISAVIQAADHLPQAVSQVTLDVIAVLEQLLRDVPDGSVATRMETDIQT